MRPSLLAVLLLLCSAPALAEEGDFTSLAGGGAMRVDTGAVVPLVKGELTYSITDRWGIAAPLGFSWGEGRRTLWAGLLALATVAQGETLRLDLRAGLPGMVGLSPAPTGLDLAAYGGAQLRWRPFWGVGLSLEAAYLSPLGLNRAIDRANRAGVVLAASLFSEF